MTRRTHLYDFHRQHGNLINFADFEQAVSFEGITPEHLAVRNNVGLFDVTHMGRCTVSGEKAAVFLNYLLTREIVATKTQKGRYAVMCNDQGGIIDDLVIFRLREDYFFLVYNADNRDKDFTRIHSKAEEFNVQVKDVSEVTAMFAIQGPKALATLQSISDRELSEMRQFGCYWVTLDGVKVLLSRSGYTGEDGFETYLWNTPLNKADTAKKLWHNILKAGEENGIKPCGLGARDTLRLEAGLCLYGNDINENITPLEAKLDFAVQFDKDDFVGKDFLLKQKAEGLKQVRIGLRLLKRGIPRPGNEIQIEGKKIGHITSGTFSPLLREGIGMGYVPPRNADIGSKVEVQIRKNLVEAEIVEMPFYDRTRYGLKRS